MAVKASLFARIPKVDHQRRMVRKDSCLDRAGGRHPGLHCRKIPQVLDAARGRKATTHHAVVDPKASFTFPPALPAFTVQLTIGVPPAMSFQIVERICASESVLRRAVCSVHTGVEIATQNCFSINKQIARWHKVVPKFVHRRFHSDGFGEGTVNSGNLDIKVIAAYVEPTLRSLILLDLSLGQWML
jgi:hypothetical protein